ncbi:MAG: hypothetical protein PF637_10010 [Spirochaetes bacterium]|jgi:hypothetical protein|nr:hypothetical protein [Spirochaetota bacterium]
MMEKKHAIHDNKIFKYHLVLKYVLPLFIFLISIYLFYIGGFNFIQTIVSKNYVSYFLYGFSLLVLILAIYLFIFLNFSYIAFDYEKISFITPFSKSIVYYANIEAAFVEYYHGDIKSIIINSYEKNNKFYGLKDLEGCLYELKQKVSEDKFIV